MDLNTSPRKSPGKIIVDEVQVMHDRKEEEFERSHIVQHSKSPTLLPKSPRNENGPSTRIDGNFDESKRKKVSSKFIYQIAHFRGAKILPNRRFYREGN